MAGIILPAMDLSAALVSVRLPMLGPRSVGPDYLDGWDLAKLGDHPIPGRSKISGGKIKLKHDKKSKPGADGANPTFHGIEPQEFNLDIEVWTDSQLNILVNRVLADVLPKPWSKPTTPPPGQTKVNWPVPLTLTHPQLAPISSVTPVRVVVLGGTPLKWSGPGLISMTLELLQWMPAPASKSSQQATPSTGVPNKRAQADAASQNPPPHTQDGFGGPPK